MSRKTSAFFVLPVLASIAIALGSAVSHDRVAGLDGGRGEFMPVATDRSAAGAFAASARLMACGAPDHFERVHSRDGSKGHRGYLMLPTAGGGECARNVTPTRTIHKAVFPDHARDPLNIRLPVIFERWVFSHRMISPLAVVMPNPRSPPVALNAIPRAAAL